MSSTPLSASKLAVLLGAISAGSLLCTGASAADPSIADCLGANESSIHLREQHKLRAALDQLLICANPACPSDVRVECARRVDAVKFAIPTVVFEAKDGAGNDVANVKVSIDGAPLVERLEGTALPLEPGEHTFRFEAPGQPPVDKVLVLREGEKDRRERIVIGPLPVAVAPTDVLRDTGKTDGKMQRYGAIGAGGVGVVGLALGTIFGISAASNWSSAKSTCGTSCAPSSPAVGERSTAQSDATVSTVGFVVAGVGLAAGAVLWFTAPRLRAQSTPVGLTPTVGPGGGGLVLRW